MFSRHRRLLCLHFVIALLTTGCAAHPDIISDLTNTELSGSTVVISDPNSTTVWELPLTRGIYGEFFAAAGTCSG
jgi:hypothetical protein